MENLPKEEFLLLFQRDDFIELHDLGEYYSIAEPIVFTNKEYNNKSIIILNRLVFEQDVLFDKTDINVSLVFRNCEFKKGLLFDGLKSSGVIDEWDSDIFGLHFENCIFNEMVQFDGRCEVERGISFKNNCQVKGGIAFLEVFITNGRLNFEDSSIDFILEVNNCVIGNLGFDIRSCQVNGQVRITAGCLSSITLFKSTFEKDIYVWAACIVNGFIVNYGHFKDDLRIQGVRGRPGLTMFSGKYDDKVCIDYEDLAGNKLVEGFRYLHFESCDFSNGLEVNGVQDVFAVTYPCI
jgi:NDP-sugar pyrophosphorylase family protein